MDITGKVVFIGDVVDVTESFKKRDLVVEYAENPQYPEQIKFEAVQAKTDLLNGLNIGDQVQVFFNLKGRAGTVKAGPEAGKPVWFNQLQLWKTTVLEAAPTPSYSADNVDINSAPDDDDLPF